MLPAQVARYTDIVSVVLGTTFGMMLANAPAVFLGERIATKVSMSLVHGIAAVVFAILGALKLLDHGKFFRQARMHTHDLAQWQHEHVFDASISAGKRGTRWVMGIPAAMMVVEIAACWLYNSMAPVPAKLNWQPGAGIRD